MTKLFESGVEGSGVEGSGVKESGVEGSGVEGSGVEESKVQSRKLTAQSKSRRVKGPESRGRVFYDLLQPLNVGRDNLPLPTSICCLRTYQDVRIFFFPIPLPFDEVMMKKRQIGRTELEVNEVGYGAMHLSIDREKRPSDVESIALIQRAVDELGVDFIDTADAYCINEEEKGHNERLIARALQGERRGRVVIATKGGHKRPKGRWERNGRPEYLRAACEASLKALEADHIDLYQFHAPDPNVPVEESIGTLVDLQREGKIRHIGISNFSLAMLKHIMADAEIVSVQNRYSVMDRREQDEIVDFCEQQEITYIPWNPVGGRGNAPEIGQMFGALGEIGTAHGVAPHTIALAWLLGRSPIMLPIPGTRKFDHLAENMKAPDIELTSDEIERLNSIG